MKEYKLVEKVQLTEIEEALNTWTSDHWGLHSIIDDGKTPWVRLVFERDVAEEAPAPKRRGRKREAAFKVGD